MPAPYSLDLQQLLTSYAAGTLTPTAVLKRIYASSELRSGHPMWISQVPLEAVVTQARALERLRAAGAALPLFGVPFAVKDNIDVAGMPTTAACPAYSYVAAETAPAVRRLQEAGALLIGKTNLDQFAAGLVGVRSPYGVCRNAFNPDYVSGGSSSGSALAVASGVVSFALGTDTAGSGRVPAGFNNIVGLKPTRGAISTRGVVPACRSLDCISIFALSCGDARSVFEVARGYDPDDIYSRPAASASTAASGQGFRCGIPRQEDLEFFGDTEAAGAFRAARDKLVLTGAELVEIDYRPFLETARLLYEGPWVAERYAAIKEFIAAHPDDILPVTRQIIEGARRWNAVDAFEGLYRLRALRRRCAAVWSRIDVLAVPTAGTMPTVAQVEAAPLDRNTELGYYTNFVNLLDLAALAVPGPFRADGLPAGITLIAPAQGEALLLQLGDDFHRAANVTLGATGCPLPARAPVTAVSGEGVTLAVVGAHLSGQPLNSQLTDRGARLLESVRTAAAYRLYALSGTGPARPGLVRTADGTGAAIECELWGLSEAAFGSFVAGVSAPLVIGTVKLADGREVKGFLCESYAASAAEDITATGGWRAYLALRTGASPGR
jgi:allophanate hydrolase